MKDFLTDDEMNQLESQKPAASSPDFITDDEMNSMSSSASVAQTPAPLSSSELNDAESLASKAYGAVDLAAEGLTRGWKSELQSGLENVVLPHYLDDTAEQREAFDRYKRVRDEYQSKTDEFKQENPRLGYIAETTGALLPYLLAPAAAGFWSNAGLGAVEGAVAGGGKSEADIGSDEFYQDVATNAAIGAGAGGVLGKLAQAAPKAVIPALIGAAATPAVTGETDPSQMGAGALLALLASRGRFNPSAVVPGFIKDVYNTAKAGVDLTSKEGAEAAREALLKNATATEKGVKQIVDKTMNPAASKIQQFFQASIDSLGSVVQKAGGDKDEVITKLSQKVYQDYENAARQFAEANPGKTIPVNKALEMAVKSLDEGMQGRVVKPEDVATTQNVLNAIKRMAGIVDEDIKITQQAKLSSASTEPETAITITGASPERAKLLAEATPEELMQQGFKETSGPQRFVSKPEKSITTSGLTGSSLSANKPGTLGEILDKGTLGEILDKGVTGAASQKVGRGGQILEETRSAMGGRASPEELALRAQEATLGTLPDGTPASFAYATTKVTPEQETETATRVFSKLFPGKATINELDAAQTVQFIKELNAISPGKSFAGSVIGDLKRALDDQLATLTKDTPFAGLPEKRGAYGEILSAKETLATDSAKDVNRLVSDMITAKKQGRFQDYEAAFESIRKYDPELATRLENDLVGEGSKLQSLTSKVEADPLTKLGVAEEQGIQIPEDIQQAGQTVKEIETLQSIVGGPSKGISASGSPLAGEKSVSFVQDLGAQQGSKLFDPSRNQDIRAATELIRKHNPALADKIENDMVRDAEIARMVRNVQGKDAESSLGFVPTTPGGVAVKTGQVIGLNKLVAHTGSVAGKIGRKVDKIQSSAKAYVSPPIESIKQALNTNVPVFGKFDKPLRDAFMTRGEGALRATIYVLSQQYPEFRLMTEQLEEESRNQE